MFNLPPLADVTDSLLSEPDHSRATMGWNLYHDRRISSQRFQQFSNRLIERGIAIDDVTQATIEDDIGDYHENRVCKTDNPEFLDPSFNANNLYTSSGPLVLPHGNTYLIRVFDLRKLHKVFEAGQGSVPEFADYNRLTSKSPHRRLSHTDWLDTRLSDFKRKPEFGFDQTRLQRNRFLIALLDFMNVYRKKHPFEPAWATRWSIFNAMNWHSPERWQRLVGVWPNQHDTWLLLLRYTVREVGLLVRPTQLDGGWYPPHFPVPAVTRPGHAMETDASQPPCTPLFEYIHQQIDHTPGHLFACGRAVAESVSLPPAQRRHLNLLEQCYPETIKNVERPHPACRPTFSTP